MTVLYPSNIQLNSIVQPTKYLYVRAKCVTCNVM